MKIQSIKKADDTIVLTLDGSYNITKVYLDDVHNMDNIYSTDSDKHTYSQSSTGSVSSIEIQNASTLPGIDSNKFVVSIHDATNSYTTFYYNEEELYYREIDLLTSYCNTCLDKQQKEDILLFSVKKELLDFAMSINNVEEAVGFYRDLDRLLQLSSKSNLIDNKNLVCRNCCNGVCKI